MVKNLAAYLKRLFTAQDETQSIKQANEEQEIQVGFVDGLFEMYKLGGDIAKARAGLMADSAVLTYNDNFGTFIFKSHCDIDYKSSWIESLIELKHWSWSETKEWKHHSLLTNF